MKRNVLFIIGLFVSFAVSAQDNWFMGQTDKAVVSSVTATSELVEAQFSGKYLYPPINILDGNFNTTWCEADENGPGIGEAITMEFAEPVSFDEIEIVNGFASGKDYYHKNNRVKKILLTQTAGKHYQQKEYELKDNVETWQPIKFALPQTAQTITIKLLEVYKGDKYDDTCLDCFRLKYKGKIIPFENVPAIKKAQEENSKEMLSSSRGAFANQFINLFNQKENGSTMYLVKAGAGPWHDVVTITKDSYSDSDSIRNVSYLSFSTSIPKTKDELKKTFLEAYDLSDGPGFGYGPRIWEATERYRSGDMGNGYNPDNWKYNPLDYKYICYSNDVPFDDYDVDWSIGNGRLIKTVRVDYVETQTVMLLKIEGNSVFINNVKYDVVPKKDIFFFSYGDYQ